MQHKYCDKRKENHYQRCESVKNVGKKSKASNSWHFEQWGLFFLSATFIEAEKIQLDKKSVEK